MGRTYLADGGGVGVSWLGGGVQVQAQGRWLSVCVATSLQPYRLAVSNHDNEAGQFVFSLIVVVPAAAVVGPTYTFPVETSGYGTQITLNISPPYWEINGSAAVFVNFSVPDSSGVFGTTPFGAPAERVLHILGDSISAATNIHGGKGFCADSGPYSDYASSWGGIICDYFNASCSTIAVGGKCLLRSCPDGKQMPDYYLQQRYSDGGATLNFSATPAPDAVIVYLGTNDWGRSTAPNVSSAFAAALLEFAHNVTRLWWGTPARPANTTFLALLGAMSPTLPAAALQDAAARGAAAGLRIVLVNSTGSCGAGEYPNCADGCAGHPGVASHRNMAADVAPVLSRELGWAFPGIIQGRDRCV